MLSPKSTSSPTNISMDIKIEKSLISLRSCQEQERKGEEKKKEIKGKQKRKKSHRVRIVPQKRQNRF